MSTNIGWRRRALVAVVAATLLTAIGAVPSFAAAKKSVLDVTPNSATGGVSTEFTVTLTNTTPGNSTINSFAVTVPWPESLTQDDVRLVASTNPNSSMTIEAVGSEVRVRNINPLKTNQFISLGITTTMPEGCDPAVYEWTAIAYAGNSLNGDQFPNQGTLVQRQVLNESCAGIRFVEGHTPQDAILNTTITNTDLEPDFPPDGTAEPVQVEYVVGGVRQDLDTGTVTLSYGTTPLPPLVPGTLSGNTATFTDGLAAFPSLTISDTQPFDAAGDYTLRASYSGFTTDSPTFRIFDALLCDGDSYTEDSASSTDSGQFTIASESSDCFGIIVNNFSGNTGTGNVDEWSAIKSAAGGTFIQGTFAINWDLGNGTTPVPWTQVTWDGSGGAYHDVQRCIAGQTGEAQFPGTEQICLLSSSLVQVGNHWEQQERFAYNTDLGARKR